MQLSIAILRQASFLLAEESQEKKRDFLKKSVRTFR